MRNALLGGIIIGILIKGWLGVFVLPVFVALFQCVELFFLLRKQNKVFALVDKEIKRYFDVNNIRTFAVQFFWSYITTTVFAMVVYFIKNVIFGK